MDRLETELRQVLRGGGAALMGWADLACVPPEARGGLPRGVSFAVPLGPDVLRGLVTGPTLDYYREYQRVNQVLSDLAERAAECLRAEGYHAVAAAATVSAAELEAGDLSTPLPHKTLATRAGLGWIGKCALLITEEYGSAVRLGSVVTDAPLVPGTPVSSSRCGRCDACGQACPAKAVRGADWAPGLDRRQYYDAHACRRVARAAALAQGIGETICGLCIVACPWTKRYLERAESPAE